MEGTDATSAVEVLARRLLDAWPCSTCHLAYDQHIEGSPGAASAQRSCGVRRPGGGFERTPYYYTPAPPLSLFKLPSRPWLQ